MTDMSKFACRTPCDSCPFRSDVVAFLRPARAREIAMAVMGGAPFHCHKTLNYDEADDDGEPAVGVAALHCAGALLFLERSTGSVFVSTLARIAANYGGWDVDKFLKANKGASVYVTAQAFVKAQR